MKRLSEKILTKGALRDILLQDKSVPELWPAGLIFERIKTIATRDLTKSVKTGGCGECQTSCQSACKTSCGVANQQCENSNK